MRKHITWFGVIAVMIIGISTCFIGCEEEINAVVRYVGKVVYAGTTDPFVELEVKITNGEKIHCINHTDDGGQFVLSVKVSDIDGSYYALVGDSSCVTKRLQLSGYGQAEVDLGTIEIEGPSLPVVKTKPVTNISDNKATCGGKVIADGRSSVTARGVCWSKSELPTIDGDHTVNGAGIGEFSSQITDLEPGMTYFVRAYATNKLGTSYGEQDTLTTATGLPQVVLDSIFDKTSSSAQCSANVTANGGYAISARGICWSDISASPTISNEHTEEVATTGKFTSMMIGLQPSHTYYVRAYAVNEKGIGYSKTIKFTTTDGKPVVETGEVSNVTATSAMIGANVISQGDSLLTECGVCWSSSTSSPSTTDDHTEEVARVGEFTSKMINLVGMTTYYVRAYATNANGTVYGNTVSFSTATTADGLPIVETLDPGENITTSSISSGGNVTNDGGFPVLEHGVVYSTLPYPTLDNANKVAAGSGTGYYAATITGITPATKTYYIRAYATNSNGTAYGDQVVATPERSEYLSLKTMVYGGYTYRIKFIGSMSWDNGNAACENMVFAGYDDWFMPNEGEMQGILEAYGVWETKKSAQSTLEVEGCDDLWTSKAYSAGSSHYYYYIVATTRGYYWTYEKSSPSSNSNIYGVLAVRKYRTDNQ